MCKFKDNLKWSPMYIGRNRSAEEAQWFEMHPTRCADCDGWATRNYRVHIWGLPVCERCYDRRMDSLPGFGANGLVQQPTGLRQGKDKDYAYGTKLNEACLSQQTDPHTCVESHGMVLGIGYDIRYDRYYMIQHSEAPKAINYCPWCGQKLDTPAGTPEYDSEAADNGDRPHQWFCGGKAPCACMESWKAGGWKEARDSVQNELEQIMAEARESLNPYHADLDASYRFGSETAGRARAEGMSLETLYHSTCTLLQVIHKKMYDQGRL